MTHASKKYLVLGTRNPNKVQSLQDKLAGHPLTLIFAKDLSLDDPVETGHTFQENALIKARAYSQATNMPALADDSGMSIPALQGFPGVRTADYIAEHGGPTQAIADLKQKLQGRDHTAMFTTCLVLFLTSGQYNTVEYCVTGTLIFSKTTPLSWGFTSIFKPDGADVVFSQMDHAQQNLYSHRAKAIDQLIDRHLHQI